jgi:hypothetical protein
MRDALGETVILVTLKRQGNDALGAVGILQLVVESAWLSRNGVGLLHRSSEIVWQQGARQTGSSTSLAWLQKPDIQP